jgi:polyphosphate kinase
MLQDHRQAWDLQPDGSYVQRTPPAQDGKASSAILGTHQALMDLTRQQAEREAATAPRCAETPGTQ